MRMHLPVSWWDLGLGWRPGDVRSFRQNCRSLLQVFDGQEVRQMSLLWTTTQLGLVEAPSSLSTFDFEWSFDIGRRQLDL
jgi:hypothetical protein